MRERSPTTGTAGVGSRPPSYWPTRNGLRVAVVHIGGSPDQAATPEVDPVNALPRVEAPFLLLSGEFDTIMPIANALHYFELLGSGEKRHVVTQGAHFVPRTELIRESLNWLNLHLGEPR